MNRNNRFGLRRTRFFFVALAVWMLCGHVSRIVRAATILVPSQRPTVQQGVDAAAAGDTVLVAPGVYVEFVLLKGKAITLKGEGTSYEAVLEGPANGATVQCINNEGGSTRITGFTIRNGKYG